GERVATGRRRAGGPGDQDRVRGTEHEASRRRRAGATAALVEPCPYARRAIVAGDGEYFSEVGTRYTGAVVRHPRGIDRPRVVGRDPKRPLEDVRRGTLPRDPSFEAGRSIQLHDPERVRRRAFVFGVHTENDVRVSVDRDVVDVDDARQLRPP